MGDFGEHPERSIKLPPGCKDLIDVIGKSGLTSIIDWQTVNTKELASVEGHLADVLRLAGGFHQIYVSCRVDAGLIVAMTASKFTENELTASCKGRSEHQAVRNISKRAGLSPITSPARGAKLACSLRFRLPPEPTEIAWLIGDLFRAGYGLRDSSKIIFVCGKR